MLGGELAELGRNTHRLGPYLSVPTSISPVYHAAGKYPPVNLLHRAKCPWEWDLLAKVSLLRSAQLGTARRQYVVRWANNRSADQSGSHGVLLELISEPHARSLHAHTHICLPLRLVPIAMHVSSERYAPFTVLSTSQETLFLQE